MCVCVCIEYRAQECNAYFVIFRQLSQFIYLESEILAIFIHLKEHPASNNDHLTRNRSVQRCLCLSLTLSVYL